MASASSSQRWVPSGVLLLPESKNLPHWSLSKSLPSKSIMNWMVCANLCACRMMFSCQVPRSSHLLKSKSPSPRKMNDDAAVPVAKKITEGLKVGIQQEG